MKYGPKPALLSELTEEDFHINTSVRVVFQDNSVIRFRSAFYRREDPWIAIYTKECGHYMVPLASIVTVNGACCQ